MHLLKCIRNNWLNQKTSGKCIVYPTFDFCGMSTTNTSESAYACFESLRHLYHSEAEKHLKFGYKLSIKALHPSNLEHQNVRLVLQIFSEFVAQALLQLRNAHYILHYQDTSAFISLILTWWEVVNVKTPRKGYRLNNKYQQSLTASNENDPKVFLWHFLIGYPDGIMLKIIAGS